MARTRQFRNCSPDSSTAPTRRTSAWSRFARWRSAVVRTRAKVLPASWVAPLVRGLSSPDPEIVTHVLSVIRTLPSPKDVSTTLQGALLQAGRDKSRSIEIRLNALAAIQNGLTVVEPDVFELLRSGLEAGHPVAVNSAAAAVVEKATFNRTQLIALAEALPDRWRARASPPAAPVQRQHRRSGGARHDRQPATVEESIERACRHAAPGAREVPGVGADGREKPCWHHSVWTRPIRFAASRRCFRRCKAEMWPVDRRCSTVRRPRATRAMRSVTWAEKSDPDLTRIGQVRSERDLLEAILFPSASFARGYEPVVVKRDPAKCVGACCAATTCPTRSCWQPTARKRGSRGATSSKCSPAPSSLMPPGLDEQLSKQELADLLAFLKATRSGAN